MFIHTIVYVILSILSVTAIYAASMPIAKDSPDDQLASESDQDNTVKL